MIAISVNANSFSVRLRFEHKADFVSFLKELNIDGISDKQIMRLKELIKRLERDKNG